MAGQAETATTEPDVGALTSTALDALADLCRRDHVRRLDLFGSALTGRFDPARSDLDFIVAFEDVPLGGFSGLWSRFHADVERLFGRTVDLVDESALENPFFRRRVLETRRRLFPRP